MSKTTIILDDKVQSGEEHYTAVIPKRSVIGCRSRETVIIGSLHERITSAYLGVNVPLRKAEQQY